MATEYSFDETTWFEEKPSEGEFRERRVFTRERLRMAAGEGEMEKNESRDHRVGDTGDTEPAALLLEETAVRRKEGHEGAVERHLLEDDPLWIQRNAEWKQSADELRKSTEEAMRELEDDPRAFQIGYRETLEEAQPKYTVTKRELSCLRGEHEADYPFIEASAWTSVKLAVCLHCRAVFVPR